MRKIILGVAVSLDGFIEDQNGKFDWCPPPAPKEMNLFLEGIDLIFVGRKSYEMMGSQGFPGKKLCVFSNTLKTKEKNVQIIGGNILDQIQQFKNHSGKDIWLFGGANLTTKFINEGLVDEMWLGLVPIILGGGKPLFQNISQRNSFTITGSIVSNGYLSLNLKKENKLL